MNVKLVFHFNVKYEKNVIRNILLNEGLPT